MSKKPAGSNEPDPVVVKRWLSEALKVYDQLDEQKIANMNECRRIRAQLPTIMESAKNAGLHSKGFRLLVKDALLQRKIEGLHEDIDALTPDDEDDAEAFEQLRAIAERGDLFSAAVDRHDKAQAAKKDGEDDDDPRPQFLKDKHDKADQTAENVERLKKGIKGMPGADTTH